LCDCSLSDSNTVLYRVVSIFRLVKSVSVDSRHAEIIRHRLWMQLYEYTTWNTQRVHWAECAGRPPSYFRHCRHYRPVSFQSRRCTASTLLSCLFGHGGIRGIDNARPPDRPTDRC